MLCEGVRRGMRLCILCCVALCGTQAAHLSHVVIISVVDGSGGLLGEDSVEETLVGVALAVPDGGDERLVKEVLVKGRRRQVFARQQFPGCGSQGRVVVQQP